MYLSLVIHNHQPVGQLPWAMEEAWRNAYQPFLDVLECFPNIRVTLHYTGPLLDWLVQHQPAKIAQIQRLLDRGQIEILSGGYYEPILTIWPEADQIAQITLLSERVAEVFGSAPDGMWLAERVWEPQLASLIAARGLHYTFLDSTLFQQAGISEAQSFGYYRISPHESDRAAPDTPFHAFPINHPLRLLIPWKDAEESLHYFQGIEQQGGAEALVVFADDGEKFGAWPSTYDWVYQRGWLEQFFSMLSANSALVTTITPREYWQKHQPSGTCQLPAGSYSEMQEWSGGNWRNFLKRYPESRDMYQEALHASHRAHATGLANKDSSLYDHVLRAQSNDAYWHGVFGGLYLPHLRQAIYAEATEAQVLMDGSKPFVRVEPGQLQTEDIFLLNEQQKVGIRASGGHIYLWISKAARHNLLATLRCHREEYHGEHLTDDWYARGALLDHFFGDGATPELFANARYPEQGDFIAEPWTITSSSNTGEDNQASITMRRDGGVWVGSEFLPVGIEKQITLVAGSNALLVAYTFDNPSDRELNLWWGNEWNIVITSTELPDRHYHASDHKLKFSLNQQASFEGVINPIVADRWLQLWVEWEFPTPVDMWHVPLYTTSQKEGGEIEQIYQQSSFVFHRRLQLAPHSQHSLQFLARITAKRSL